MRMPRVASVMITASIFCAGLALAATAATVTCKDGTTGPGGRGACRGHGGIDKAGAPERAPEAEGAATTVTCKDGATSKGGRGACRGHGGIAKAGETAPAAPS